jgi:hypothetical protein
MGEAVENLVIINNRQLFAIGRPYGLILPKAGQWDGGGE